jgi:putative SOS response-associated peptidase YedK
MINARMEGIEVKPAFRKAFARRRCLIPADGFYEWKKTPRGKQPYYYQLSDGGPFAFGGLWERWEDHKAGQEIDSCTIITTPANELLAEVHDRMPLILDPRDYTTWLNAATAKEQALSLLRPYPAASMTAHPVSAQVNNPKNEGPDLVASEQSEKIEEPKLFAE